MLTPYTKPHLPLPDQLNLLKSRGLQVTNDAEAIDCLHRNGYYRLSAYWYPFRKLVAANPPVRSDVFLADSRFEDAVELYIFDKKLKLLLLDALERVEIAVRVEIALLLGSRDPFAHTNASLFHPNFISNAAYQKWCDKFDGRVAQSRDEFVFHYEKKYGSRSPLPIWIAIELWDFGLLSHLFSGMTIKDRQAVAVRFSVPNWQLMESWLRCLNYVRNVIAHHGRLWNLNLSVNPKLPRQGEMAEFDVLISLPNVGTRIYSACCILSHLSRIVNSTASWPHKLTNLVNNFPSMPYASARDMGFSPDWRTHSFWK